MTDETAASQPAEMPFVTVAVPCYNEAGHIDACVQGILEQDYPTDNIEVLVADGMSTDGTRDRLRQIARTHPKVLVLDNPSRLQATGLNTIIRRSRGDVIVRMDVHCSYARDYVRRCVEELERTGADNVGGAQRTRSVMPFQAALCAALASPLGMGLAPHRLANHEGFVQTVFLGAFRRRVFEQVGLYDPCAVTNEDAELNQRILAVGGRIYMSRAIVVHYYPRRSMRSLAIQYFRYGRGRARTLLRHKSLGALRPALPLLWLTSMALLASVPVLRPVLPWALGGYLGVVGIEALRVARSLPLRGRAAVALIFPTMHVSHGLGFAGGLARYLIRPDWGAIEMLPPRDAVTRRGPTGPGGA